MTETNEQRMARIAGEEQAVAAIRILCETFAAGGLSFRQTTKLIEDVLEDQSGRMVRVGSERHSPEVKS